MSTPAPAVVWQLRRVIDAHPDAPSVRALAKATGVSYTTLHGIVTGRSKRADLATLASLCGALGVTPGDLLEYVPATTRKRGAK